MVQFMLASRLGGDVDELGVACNVGDNLWITLLPAMRRLVEQPSLTIERRMNDLLGPVWGTKKILHRTPWQIEHEPMSRNQREGLYLKRAAKIYDSYIGEYCTRIIDICDAAGIMIFRDNRFTNDGSFEGTESVWKPTES
jgi:hypothetical protein